MALISKKFNDALVAQIAEEFHSAYLYLSMSIWLKERSFSNLANWFSVQYGEEIFHARKLIDFVIEVGGTINLPDFPAPKSDWTSVGEIVKGALEHEKYITKKIFELVTLSEELKEFASREFLSWFVTEQVEEEASTGELVEKHKAFNNDMLFDQYTVRNVSEE